MVRLEQGAETLGIYAGLLTPHAYSEHEPRERDEAQKQITVDIWGKFSYKAHVRLGGTVLELAIDTLAVHQPIMDST